MDTRPVSQSTSTRYLRSAMAPVMRPAVGAERDEVEGLVLPRHRVAVVVAPCVLEIRVLRVGAVPFVDAGRLLHEILETPWIAADLEAIHLDVADERLRANALLGGFR